ncbi:unnamed protein product [Gordionus sp. m RMFG-2023]|uniref:CKLF-like MARVEL transmembrane domain-containing protein 4 n=1 Tax=Gordionus sp. m RMFG-2023 TaxID=3053472 RepID=UPI0030E16BEE
MCQVEKSTAIFDPICGPLDLNFSKSATGIILVTQMLVAILAFFIVEFSTWCLESVGSIRTFTTLTLSVFWLNMIFLIVFVCNIPYKLDKINWLLITFLQQFFCALFIFIAIIVLAINPCTIGHMIGVITAIVLLLFYLLGALLVFKNYSRPDRSTEPMDPVNADIPEVSKVTSSIRDKLDGNTSPSLPRSHLGDNRVPTPPGPYLAPPPHPPPPSLGRPPPPPPFRTINIERE